MRHIIAALGIAAAFALTAMAANEASKAQPPSAATPVPAASGGTTTPPTQSPTAQPTPAAKKPAQATPEKKVDLNNASKAELMTLPSVGEAEAVKIIANRPYVSKIDLVTKAGLPQGVYLAVRHKVAVNDMKMPASKPAAPKK